MGCSVSVVESQQNDWFANQGYALEFETKLKDDLSHKVFNNDRLESILPVDNPEAAKRNDDIYQYIRRVKEQSDAHPLQSREILEAV